MDGREEERNDRKIVAAFARSSWLILRQNLVKIWLKFG